MLPKSALREVAFIGLSEYVSIMSDFGPCPLCGRPMIEGSSVNRHHLVPKSKDGVEAELCHVVCHSKVHSTLTEAELAGEWNTWARLKRHPEISKFVKWVKKRHPEYVDVHLDTNVRKWKRGRR